MQFAGNDFLSLILFPPLCFTITNLLDGFTTIQVASKICLICTMVMCMHQLIFCKVSKEPISFFLKYWQDRLFVWLHCYSVISHQQDFLYAKYQSSFQFQQFFFHTFCCLIVFSTVIRVTCKFRLKHSAT